MRSPEPALTDIEGILPHLLQRSGAALAIKDLDGRYLYANDGFGTFAGRPAEELIGRDDEVALTPERVRNFARAHHEVLALGESVSVEEEVTLSGEAALFISTHFPIHDERQRLIAIGVVALQTARRMRAARRTERALKRAESENAELTNTVRTLEELALTDALTGAWNRRRLEEAIDSEIHRAVRYSHSFSLLMVDIDHFKAVNDSLGHQAGDKVLAELASVLKRCVRKSDSVTRWGGEEFVLMLPNTGLAAAQRLAGRIRKYIENHEFAMVEPLTVSIGVAEYSSTESWEQCLRRSDQALYEAKKAGRNRVAISRAPETACAADDNLDGNFVKLVWSDRFNSGHETIDAQHERLVQVANELLVAVLSSRPNGHILDISGELIKDIKQHFSDEEALLAEIGYPQRQEHAREHQALVARAEELEQAVRDGELSVGELFQYLAYEVISRHVLGADRHYFPFLPDNTKH